ncbi:NAD(P)-binding domain-containing protein [Lysobacter korlensis]|uniref:NAD(P)-binding domain-containing protein n=1 Tax=Lysobacter korlensis TaxID=553636 RepID=A0ABV6RTH6_9GAMM
MTLLDTRQTAVVAKTGRDLPVAIIGAGPVGLAAAAELRERGVEAIVLEAGDSAGAAVAAWGHIRLFSPWELLIAPAARRLLESDGWTAPSAAAIPTGAELVEGYLAPLAAALASHIRTRSAVTAVTRTGMDRTRSAGRENASFTLRVVTPDGGTELTARAVIDASGTFFHPNGLASNGLEPLGAENVRDAISPAMPDVLGAHRERFAGRHTTVLGAGHSAANTLLNLAALAAEAPGTRVTWAIRNDGAVRIGSSEDDGLSARAAIGGRLQRLVDSGVIQLVRRFELSRLHRAEDGAVALAGTQAGEPVELRTDEVVAATGFRPDLGMLREIRLDLDEIVEAPRRLAPLIDPNVHSCGTVEPHGFAELRHPEKDFFVVGMKSYGRAPTFLLATGYEQVRSVAAYLDGDLESAARVQLRLPATGVCSTDVAGSCC